MIALIIGLLLLGWLLSGYSRKRRLETEVAGLYFIGIGQNAIWLIDSDKLWWIFKIIPLPRPFRRIPPRLKWTEWVDSLKRVNEKIINLQTGEEEDKFKDIDKFEDGINGFLGYRDEFVPFIKKFETVSYNIQVESGDGYSFNLIPTLTYNITDAANVIRIPSFKMLGNRQLENKLPAWAYKRTIDEIKTTDADLIKDPNCGIIVEDGKDLITDFNEKNTKLGFPIDVDKVGLKIIEGKSTKNYFALRQENRENLQKIINMESEKTLRSKKREIEKDDADQENKIMEDRLNSIYKGLQPMMHTIFAGKAYVQAQRPNVMVEVNNEADDTGEKMFEIVGDVIKSVHNNSQSKTNQKKEEKNDENARSSKGSTDASGERKD